VRLACIVGVLLLWQLGSVIGFVPRDAIASPVDIAVALGHLVGTEAFWGAIGVTMLTWATGLGLSTAIALPLGIAFGISFVVYRMFRNTVDFLRAIPPVALVPVVLLLFGATPTMAVALIVFGSVWPLLIQTMYGVHQVDPVARDVARSYRLTGPWVFATIVLPSAAPFIATGFRIAATMSLLLTIGAQVIGGAPGIGEELDLARQTGLVPVVYAYIVTAGAIGVVINLALLRIERSALAWHPSYR
jgi:ABC-type nitrate/sulfonate/bicarbonate transport system permease component